MKMVIALMLLCLSQALALAQDPASVQKEEMKKMHFLLGTWKGEGWIMTSDGKRRTFQQTERIQSKLDGLAILIEGEGKAKSIGIDGKEEEVTVFRSLAIINYDDQNKRYRFVSQTTQQGRYAELEAKLIENGLEWGIPGPHGDRIRYTIKLTEKGEWFEIGEFSSDEKKWRQFHEMTLRRVD